MGRARRGSSNLGADIRGDTSAPAISTLQRPTSPASSSSSGSEAGWKPHSKRRKARSFLRRWKQVFFKHTWVTPLVIILIVLAIYAINPTESNPVHKALFLSYALPPDHRYPLEAPYNATLGSEQDAPIMYGKGPHDLTFVAFYAVVLSFTREFLMQRVIRPLAIRAGIRSRAKQSRFMEQVYTAMYFAVFGPFGLYVMSRGPLWFFDTTAMFEGFPHRKHEAVFKAYYLLQASYWSQQGLVLMLQLEKPRKDFKELVAHHIITLALIGLSYRFHFTYMGLAVYITHDISDFFLATSKTLNYVDSIIVGPYFGFFVFVWIYMRHYLNLCILWATVTKFRTVGPFDLDWDTQQYKCWISQYITFALLASLQAVNLFWLFLIFRIAKNYLLSSVELQDDRSDVEDEDEEIEEDTSKGQSRKLLESQKPEVHLNGKPMESGDANVQKKEAVPQGVRERRKAR